MNRDPIPEEALRPGHLYLIKSRNLSCGVWTGHAFLGIREKFGYRYLDQEYLYGPASGTARPFEDWGPLPPHLQRQALNPVMLCRCGARRSYRGWQLRGPAESRAEQQRCAHRASRPIRTALYRALLRHDITASAQHREYFEAYMAKLRLERTAHQSSADDQA